jgi:hypothetical protein
MLMVSLSVPNGKKIRAFLRAALRKYSYTAKVSLHSGGIRKYP